MAKRLTRLQVDEVSVVDKAANGKRFLILKAAHGGPDTKAPNGAFERLQQRLRKAAGRSGPTTEVDEMTPEDIKKAIAEGAVEALAPMQERIEKLETALAERQASSDDGAQQVTKADQETGATAEQATVPSAEDIAKMVTAGVTEALKPLADRIEKLENIEGVRQSGQDDAGAHQVAKNAGGFWEGSGLLMG